MKRPIRPASALGWWAFWLCLAATAWGALLPFWVELFSSMLRRVPGRPFPIPIGLTSAAIEFALAISALVVGVIALRKGERSWLTLLTFGLAVLVGGFWILFGLGEVLFPH